MALGGDIFGTQAVLADQRVARGLAAQFATRRQDLADSEPLGWKVGLNAPAAMENLGTAGPLVGYLTTSTQLQPGDYCSIANATFAGLEPEVAIHLGSDVGPKVEAASAAEAIAAVGAAIEVVDVDMPIEDVERILARNVFHRAVLLGEPRSPWSDCLSGAAAVTVNGEPVATSASLPSAHELAATVAHIGALVGSGGESLSAGDVIIAGALTQIVPVRPGDQARVDLGSLGSLELHFAA